MAACPPNSFRLNGTLCVCDPGYLLDLAGATCTLFVASPGDWTLSSGVDNSFKFPTAVFSFDAITKLTNSQAVFLEATLVALLSWLLFVLALRFGKIDGGNSIWFQIRWWISRLDFIYATQHWLDDQKVVKKRKTELGGTFSIACSILFIGLFAALLYQIIAKRTIEVHNIQPTNAPDLISFVNDMEFNLTTISIMSCSNLRGIGTLVIGSPGSVNHRVSPLLTFANYSCYNTSSGPTVTIKCDGCRIPRDSFYISWQFVDLPNNPALAVAFQFNLTAKSHGDNKHVSFVSGTLMNGSGVAERPNTFRGPEVNIMQFRLFPHLYKNFHNLRLVQPLFHEFLPGSSMLERSQLQASLQNLDDGLINMTLHVNFLSDYIVEINNQNVLGLVGFLADVGGLYAFSVVIFLYILLQFEHRIKKLRNEDCVMRKIRSRKRAQHRWDKLRKYVMYTLGVDQLDQRSRHPSDRYFSGTTTIESLPRVGSLHKRKQHVSVSLDKGTSSIIETVAEHELLPVPNNEEYSSRSDNEEISQPQASDPIISSHPIPPLPEVSLDRGNDISVLHKNLQNLYDYNTQLRERLMATEYLLEGLCQKASILRNSHSGEHGVKF